ncbi:MAG: GGDEF domain-containing protein [Saccharofermentans sp.]|nr:GGDEF domain-containing protein [Saccharofermentans sp.]
MGMDYTSFYVEANIFSIIIFMMLLIRELGTVGRQSKQLLFINILFAHVMYFLCDICWVLILGDCLPNIPVLTAAVNIINAITLSIITGSWFVYTELSQGEEYMKRFKTRMLVLIPAMISSLVMIVLFVFFPETVLSGTLTLTMTYYIVFLIVPVIYIIVSTVRTFIRAFKKENYAFRSPYIASAIYPAALAVIGVIQTLWVKAPMFCFGCAVMMIYVYITSLNNQVSIDELTKLNNRSQLKKYVASEAAKQTSDKNTRFVLMIDLNKFKQINDQYGHIEGDIALKRTADALKISCAESSLKTFIARYGGDEFIIIAKSENEEQVKDLCRVIKESLTRLNKEAGSPYELSASIGYACYSGAASGFYEALGKADKALYNEKAALSLTRA